MQFEEKKTRQILEGGTVFRKSILNIHWKDWGWNWNSSTLATWCEELTHWKRPWCWERLRAGGEGDDRGWDGSMASLTHGHEFEQALGDGEGQGSLACCSPWGRKRDDLVTEQQQTKRWDELKSGQEMVIALCKRAESHCHAPFLPRKLHQHLLLVFLLFVCQCWRQRQGAPPASNLWAPANGSSRRLISGWEPELGDHPS